ncbi:hypothetical protein HKD37_14G040115 [Glycine soja]
MKADMEAMKEQITTMMEAMANIRKMMEDNTATVVATSTATEIDSIHPAGFNKVNPPVSDAVGQGGEAAKNACGPHHVQVQSKHSFPPYGLPPNYTPPTVVYAFSENINNSSLVLINNQQPQSDHANVSQPIRETHEVPQDHTLEGFGVYPGYATEGQAFYGICVLNAPRISQCCLLSQPLHFVKGKGPSPVLEKERIEDLAAQVAPLMMEKEMITMIVDTLSVFYYEKMVGYMPSSFADLVFAGERIEMGLRRGKFDYAVTARSSNRRPVMSEGNKKEGETHVVTTVPTWPNFPLAPLNPMYQYPPQQYQYLGNISPSYYSPPYQPRMPNHPQRSPLNQPQNPPAAHLRPNTTPNTNQNTNQGRHFPEKKLVEFTPIPILYSDLLPYLLDNEMVVIRPSKIPQPSFPRGYNPNVTCAYHGGVLGHSIEHCITLKHKVQSLIDASWLRFEEENRL